MPGFNHNWYFKNKGRTIEMQAGNQEWKFFVEDFPGFSKGSFLVPVLLLEGHRQNTGT